MKAIKNKVCTYLENDEIWESFVDDVRKGDGIRVRNYSELIEKIAWLSFKNPEFVLFFRGQGIDFKDNNHKTTLYPSIFRGPGYDYDTTAKRRFENLEKAEEELIQLYTFEGTKNIRVYGILRWAILQHYEVCRTPLLDITHSIRVACSFAYHDRQTSEEAYVYVLGMPQISGSITASSEHGIQIIRLLSICPPDAKRPYYQEGYLAGEFPTIGYIEKGEYELTEMDFAARLICKFRFDPTIFRSEGFDEISKEQLYPENDNLIEIAKKIKEHLPPV